MRVLITGSAGFIGFHLTNQLLNNGYEVVGIDNINDYYDVNLKYDRLRACGIERHKIVWNQEVRSDKYEHYTFVQLNLEDKDEFMQLCKANAFDFIINLAAQAGVRYSILNPDCYIQSNIVGFLNVLEACRHNKVKHLIYASSSSVYGLNERIPFSIRQSTNHPVSLYAATKKANELMAHTYSYLYNIPTTGLRFFTVYGPWGRPDMAYYSFTQAILEDKPISVFNHGRMKRDFTYIDDIVAGIVGIMKQPCQPYKNWSGKRPDPASSIAPYHIYNLGNNKPVELLSFIHELERHIGKKAILKMNDMQPGDVPATWANINDSITDFDYRPFTSIEEGIRRFANWYFDYHSIKHLAKTEEFIS